MIKDLLENKYVHAGLVIFILLYASSVQLQVSDFMVKLFNNVIFRILFLFFILIRGYKDPKFSLLMAIAFLLIMDQVNRIMVQESFTTLTNEEENRERAFVQEAGVWTLNPEKCSLAQAELAELENKLVEMRRSCARMPSQSLKDLCIKEFSALSQQHVIFKNLLDDKCKFTPPTVLVAGQDPTSFLQSVETRVPSTTQEPTQTTQ